MSDSTSEPNPVKPPSEAPGRSWSFDDGDVVGVRVKGIVVVATLKDGSERFLGEQSDQFMLIPDRDLASIRVRGSSVVLTLRDGTETILGAEGRPSE